MAREVKNVAMEWKGHLRFAGGEPGKPEILLDGDSETSQSPMVALLVAAAGCTMADVVVTLRKMRVELHAFRVEVAGTRREEEPRRYVAIRLVYHVKGAGLDEVKARRAIDLSIEKYCSVMHSLAKDIETSYGLVLES